MVARWLGLWLTLRDPVGPREYLWSGLVLMALKYRRRGQFEKAR